MLVTEDSFAALILAFKRSPKWEKYSEGTRDTWGRELDFMMRPGCLGAKKVNELRPAIVQAYFDGLAGRPGKQDSALSVLKQLEKWAIVRDLLPRQITLGVETEESDDEGHVPWTDDQVAHGSEHCKPWLARVIVLGANTGQRGSDLIRLAPTDVENYQGIEGHNVTQKKTGKQVWVPITAPLAAAIKTWERLPGPYLRRSNGKPWEDRPQLSKAWLYERRHNRAVEELKRAGLTLHGLRATACVRLRRAGATIPQIADMVGMSEEMVARYCRHSIQKENAVAAVIHLERTISERRATGPLKLTS